MQQSLQNQKLQSLLDLQLSQPPPVQAVEAATLTRTVDPFVISSSIPVPVESASPTSVVHSVSSTPGVNTVPPPYVPPPMLAGPSAFAVNGSLGELVDGRIPRNGDIEIRFCKPAAAGAGPSNQPNRGQFLTDHFSPSTGGTIPHNEDESKKDRRDDRKRNGGGGRRRWKWERKWWWQS